MAISENARERDLYKYYEPWLDVRKLGNVPVNQKTAVVHRARASQDKALTAFAQLAALRLNVKRGMVSLIDSKTQIILAEATKSLSLVDDNRHAPEDHIWLGNVSIPRDDAVCANAFGSTYVIPDDEHPGKDYTAEALVVPEMREDDRFKDRPYVAAEGGVRFYAGVPIITSLGNKIGVYAVSDTKPRAGLTKDELEFMKDMAAAIFEHLDMVKSRNDRDRGERMVQGLTSFIEELSPLKYQERAEGDKTSYKRQSESSEEPSFQESSEQSMVDDSTSSSLEPQDEQDVTSNSENVSSQLQKPDEGDQPSSKPELTTSKPKTAEADSSTSDLKHIFTSAAEVIRTAVGADGCVFFDASSGAFGDHRYHGGSTNHSEAEEIQSSSSDTDNASHGRHANKDPSVQNESDKPNADQKPPPARMLGFSLLDPVSKLSSDPSISEFELKRCLQRYPYGHVFNFDEHGSVSSGDDSLSDHTGTDDVRTEDSIVTTRRNMKRVGKFLPKSLFDLLPNARALVFLPLYDFAQNRWFAGGFLWTTRAGRFGDKNDLMPYLKAFGSCIMTEVATMETLYNSRAKTTFIASISHELRSPLHGILGSIEFLEETLTTPFQMGLMHSIEACGKTLLDTIDHLLDYAKINNLNKARTRGKPSMRAWRLSKSNNSSLPGTLAALTADINLAYLVEDVIDVVYTGQTFRRAHPRLQTGEHASTNLISKMQSVSMGDVLSFEETIEFGQAKLSPHVLVLLNISKAPSWWVRSQPGALRRIIMNLFGNSVKYCERGSIEVSLNFISTTDSHTREPTVTVELIIKDTGRGMSRQFMANHLFRPFAQEDSFSYGTGLGLSIVKQIVDSLRGKIDIKSEKNVGTEVKVLLTFPLAEQPLPNTNTDDVLGSAVKTLKGKTISILKSESQPNGQQKKNQSAKICQSLTRTCEDWFEMKCIESTNTNAEADILFYAEPPDIKSLVEHYKTQQHGLGDKPLLIMCSNVAEASSLRAGGVQHLIRSGRIIEVISQPYGPKKLGDIMQDCVRRAEESRSSRKALPDIMADQPPNLIELLNSTQQMPPIEEIKISIKPKGLEPVVNPISTNIPKSIYDLPKSRLPSQSPTVTAHTVNNNLPYVLLVDDNQINLKLLTMFMKKTKLPSAEAVNGLDAVEKFQKSDRPFNYILMDISMPVMDGLEATRKIREHEREKQLKPCTIIALTGLASGTVQDEAFQAGISHFLTKPVQFKALKQLLDLNKI